jgi:hypothetical protein
MGQGAEDLDMQWARAGVESVGHVASPPVKISAGVKALSPDQYMKVHDAAILAYENNTPASYRYSAVGLRRAVDAAFEARAALTSAEGSEV